MHTPTVVKVKGLKKSFKLPTHKTSSIKSIFTNMRAFGDRSFEVQEALMGLDFEVNEGEFFGIVGRNGSGKSTLLKLLAGIYQPTEGDVTTLGRIVPFIELGVGFNPELSGRDNVYLNGAMLGFTDKQIEKKYNSILEFAELERFMDQKLKNYSSGMQVRLAFSVATILAESDILLLDEVLAVGDAEFQRKCYSYFKELKKRKKTVVLVTHDMDVVREFCDRGILIDRGRVSCSGTAEQVAREYLKIFETKKIAPAKPSTKKEGTRWGDESVKYSKVSIKKSKASYKISFEAIAKESVESPIYGFLIKGPDGRPVLGTNSHIKKLKPSTLASGSKVKMTWEFPAILGNGIHYVDIAITQNDGATVHDWWESAAAFEVTGQDKTPYSVSPSINLENDSHTS
jgi:ABC-2 type transport system ATP-binding protein